METKTIILKESEGKRYELHLFDVPEKTEFGLLTDIQAKIMGAIIHNRLIFAGPVSDFISNPYKEEIAEKVCEMHSEYVRLYKDYFCNLHPYHNAINSLMSAIGEYKYFILTETTI